MERGKGIPKEREVKRRREGCDWEGSVCAREGIGASSMLRLIHTVQVTRGGSNISHERNRIRGTFIIT